MDGGPGRLADLPPLPRRPRLTHSLGAGASQPRPTTQGVAIDSAETDLIAAQDALREAQDATEHAARARDHAIIRARSEGIPAARIAHLLNIDRQIIYRVTRRK